APRPTSTSAGPPRGRGPAWERPGARPGSLEPLVRRVRRPVPRGDAGRLGSGPALGPGHWSPSSDEYVGRSPEGTRAGLGAARRSARVIGAPRPTSTSAGPPRGRGPAWERPGARPGSLEPLVRRVRRPVPRGDAGRLGSGPALGPGHWSPSSDEYVGRSPEGTRAGLGAARRSARVIGAPRPTSTSAGPPRGRGPAWERPGARPGSLEPLVRRVRRPVPRGDAGRLGSGPALGPRKLEPLVRRVRRPVPRGDAGRPFDKAQDRPGSGPAPGPRNTG